MILICISTTLFFTQCKQVIVDDQMEELETVFNEEETKNKSVTMSFVEDLSIYKETWTPSSVRVDNNGNIYIFPGRQRELFIFDPSGNEISSGYSFRRGQAPGEFEYFDPFISQNGQLYVMDLMQRRLVIFNSNFAVQENIKLKFNGTIMRLDSFDNIYAVVGKPIPREKNKRRLTLTKFSKIGDELHQVTEYAWGPYTDNQGIHHEPVFPRQLRYKIAPNDHVYFAYTDKYEVSIALPSGELLKKIQKKERKRRVTQKEIDLYCPVSKSSSFTWDMPDFMPEIVDLFIFDNQYLLVATFRNDIDAPFLSGDLFDENGYFVGQVEVPKYSGWEFMSTPSKRKALMMNNKLYTIVVDENEENIWIKRYKIKNWDQIKAGI